MLLLSDVDAVRQEEMLADLTTAIVTKVPNGTIHEKDGVGLANVISFLRGTKDQHTGNIGEEVTTLIDSDTESLRDFVLRTSLMVPVASKVEVDVTNSSGLLHYSMEVKAMRRIQQHTLFPPTSKTISELLWDPYRAMFYLTPLQRKLEYENRVGHLVKNYPVSLEDDKTTCLPSVVVSETEDHRFTQF